MKYIIFLCLCMSQVAFAGSNFPDLVKKEKGDFNPLDYDFLKDKRGLRLGGCSDTLPVDEYLRCKENQFGRLVGDASTIPADLKIELKQDPRLQRSDCWRLIEVNAFNQCLNDYIKGRTQVGEIQPIQQAAPVAGDTAS